MAFLTVTTWVRFLVWMLIGFVVYFLYSRSHSRLARPDGGLTAARSDDTPSSGTTTEP
jgi:APA family basic amino acid/polyamine antiporter